MGINNLVRDALELNATYAAIINVADIKFNETFRILCEKSCGMPYYNGKNTVSYVGLILFNVND